MPEPIDYRSFDRPGTLSIVLQGGLSADNLIQTAQHAEHWRQLFPAAQLILAVSVTDLIEGEIGPDGTLSRIVFAGPVTRTRYLDLALALLVRCCDSIVLSPGALPLPKIKSDSRGSNNVNLQIAAARSGLAAAIGHYCLRIRADMIFADRSFLPFYFENVGLPRGPTAVLDQRVLISEYFTLNPFTLERLPLHFSDWFHFGLREDVRRLWDVAPMSYADSVHYRTHAHDPASNTRERCFHMRLAVEQHLVLATFGPHIPSLNLDFHNDQRSSELACRVLVDNFVVGDLRQCRLYFEKYDHALRDTEMPVKCITYSDWLALVRQPDVPAETYFQDKIAEAGRLLQHRKPPLLHRLRRPRG